MVKELIAYLVLTGVIFLYTSGLELSFSPFCIKLPTWLNGVGIVLIILGVFLTNLSSYREGEIEGQKKTIQQVTGEIFDDKE